MITEVIIVGGGGHAKVVIDLVEQLPSFSILGITEKKPINNTVLAYRIIGRDDCIAHYSTKEIQLLNGIGVAGNGLRNRLYQQLTSWGYRFANIQHPRSVVSEHADLGQGVQVMAGAVVQADAQLADNTLINTGAVIEHDVVIGCHTHIAPNATVLGGARIGQQCLVGAGAVILPGVCIADHCVIAAGAVVTADLPPHTCVAGVPAKPFITDACNKIGGQW